MTMLAADQEYFRGLKSNLEKRLDQNLEISQQPFHKIVEAMRYSLLSGGKRVRGVLFLIMADSLNIDMDLALDFASALEMVHAYSLIHDDLPAMDNDDMRRGKPSNHKAFGEAIAILAGDGLLNLAFEILSNSRYQGTNTIKASSYLARMSGINGMIGGQVMDLSFEGKDPQSIAEKDLLLMIDLKCGALFRASLVCPAILAQLSSEVVLLIEDFASQLGTYFQMQDDILDITSTSEILGKSIGKDVRDDKVSSLTFYGFEKLKEIIKRLEIEMIERLNNLEQAGLKVENLNLYLDQIIKRSY